MNFTEDTATAVLDLGMEEAREHQVGDGAEQRAGTEPEAASDETSERVRRRQYVGAFAGFFGRRRGF